MREILFRGKRVDNGEWVEGLFIHMNEYPEMWVPFTAEEMEFFKGHIFEKTHGVWAKIDPETIGQFTGLLDKNGKKIFEGDIVEYRRVANSEIIYKVIWQQEWSRFAFMTCSAHGYNLYEWAERSKAEYMCEIIGNTHDNPELLEVKK